METYHGLHAESMTARDFWSFVRLHRAELLRFLQWAGAMRKLAL